MKQIFVFFLSSLVAGLELNKLEGATTTTPKPFTPTNCKGVEDYNGQTESNAKKALKKAHFNNDKYDALANGYNVAHMYAQSKIAANVNSYINAKDFTALGTLLTNLFEFDDNAYVTDPSSDPSNTLTNPSPFTILKYSTKTATDNSAYVKRNGATVVTLNGQMQLNAESALKNIQTSAVVSNTQYKKLLLNLCWAPANLRYGKTKTNDVVAANLDPMGDNMGFITTQEKWFRGLDNNYWTSATCNTNPPAKCRPSSTGMQ